MPVEAETGVSYGDLDEQYMTARFCVTLNPAEFTKLTAYHPQPAGHTREVACRHL